jgi:hypothetical protein
MRWQIAVAGLSALILACAPGDEPAATEPSFDATLQAARAEASRNFSAHLSGREEVPPVQTLAQGQAHFRLSASGDAIEYRLIAANIEDLFMAHIHLQAPGANGPIVVWLYPPAPPPQLIPGRFDGVLAEGTFTAANLMGPLAGMSLEDLVAEMRAGNTYVNIHTTANPGGEVRGQIR